MFSGALNWCYSAVMLVASTPLTMATVARQVRLLLGARSPALIYTETLTFCARNEIRLVRAPNEGLALSVHQLTARSGSISIKIKVSEPQVTDAPALHTLVL